MEQRISLNSLLTYSILFPIVGELSDEEESSRSYFENLFYSSSWLGNTLDTNTVLEIMESQRVYADTSVFGGVFDEEFEVPSK